MALPTNTQLDSPIQDATSPVASETEGLNISSVVYLMMCVAYASAATQANKDALAGNDTLLYVEDATIIGGTNALSAELQIQQSMEAQLANAGVEVAQLPDEAEEAEPEP